MIHERGGGADVLRPHFRDASWRPTIGREWLLVERRALIERLVRERLPALDQLAVCDIGCGRGGDLQRWGTLGVPADGLYGTELSPDHAEDARRAVPGGTIADLKGSKVPFADRSFDLVTATLVLSSVPDLARRRELLAEMRRVTRPGGLIAVYDRTALGHWNPNAVALPRAELVSVLGSPTSEHRLAPLLPLLDAALKLPPTTCDVVIRLLPRTHRLWTWTRRA
jgi:SAM-dependent methyltransferase